MDASQLRPRGQAARARRAGGGARLRQQRAQGVRGAARHVGHRAHLPCGRATRASWWRSSSTSRTSATSRTTPPRSGVPVILLVEDNVRYYSSFLPTIYTELIHQSERLISEGVNLSHKLVRMRARPKILLVEHLRGGLGAVHPLPALRAGSHLRRGVSARRAGARAARDSSWPAWRAKPSRTCRSCSSRRASSSRPGPRGRRGVPARSTRTRCSPICGTSWSSISRSATSSSACRTAREVGRASDLKTSEELLQVVPAESIAFHGERNHFSNWFTARTEIRAGAQAQAAQGLGFRDARRPASRSGRLDRRSIAGSRARPWWPTSTATPSTPSVSFFTRIGGGSLGGKARGLAFVRFLLGLPLDHAALLGRAHHGACRRSCWRPTASTASSPTTTCSASRLSSNDDDEIAASLPRCAAPERRAGGPRSVSAPSAVAAGGAIIEPARGLAVPAFHRASTTPSCSPNDHPATRERLAQLAAAIKRVYASTFSHRVKAYLRATPYSLEEEKMAVLLQKVVGTRHGPRYYPDFSGVARSHNFYPSPPLRSGGWHRGGGAGDGPRGRGGRADA